MMPSLQWKYRVERSSRAFQGTDRLLSGTYISRPDLSYQRKQKILQDAWNTIIRSQAWETESWKTVRKREKQEYQDNTDRIEVERAFSLSKHCYGMGLIRAKLYDTILTSIALSVFVTNLFKIQSRILFTFLWLLELLTHQSADFELEAV